MSADICYWLDDGDGQWKPGCFDGTILFPNGKGPVVSCKGVCPNCGNTVFEKVKQNPDVDDFLMELNVREFHK